MAMDDLNGFFETAAAGLLVLDPATGRVLRSNRWLRRLLGRTAAELSHATFDDLRPAGDDAVDWSQVLQDDRDDGRPFIDCRLMPRDGEPIWVRMYVSRMGSPEATRLGAVIEDISERRQGEMAGRSIDERFRSVVENIRDYAIYATDPDGVITDWTAGARRVKGYEADEVVGRHISMFYTQEDIDQEQPARTLEEARRTGRSERESWHVRKDGSWFWANEIVTPIRGADGRLLGYTKISRDMTSTRVVEEERERQLTRERVGREAAEAFLAVMSHELRTPVTTIYGTAVLLGKQAGRADQPELLRDIEEEADRLLRIIDDLMVLSGVERGHLRLTSEPVLVHAVATGVVERVLHRFPAVALEVDIPATLPPVTADPTALRQILYNLATNAAKYAGQHGPIRITGRQDASRVVISVLDDGPGLGPDPESLFQLFYRGRHTSSMAAGTGIGLYVVRQLIEAMGGSIEASDRTSGGACFQFTLPVEPTDEIDDAM